MAFDSNIQNSNGLNISKARYSLHTIPSGTFSIPSQDNFTLGGTQAWTQYHVLPSEMVVNEGNKTVQIRMGQGPQAALYNFLLGATGATAGNLSNVLQLGNNTGANNIIVDTMQYIKSGNGGGRIDLDAGGIPDNIAIYTDNGLGFQSNLGLGPSSSYISTPSHQLFLGLQPTPTGRRALLNTTGAANQDIYLSTNAMGFTAAVIGGTIRLDAGTYGVISHSDIIVDETKVIKSGVTSSNNFIELSNNGNIFVNKNNYSSIYMTDQSITMSANGPLASDINIFGSNTIILNGGSQIYANSPTFSLTNGNISYSISGVQYATQQTTTTGATSSNLTLDVFNSLLNEVMMVTADVQGFGATGLSYTSKVCATFKNLTGVVSIIGATSSTLYQKSEFGVSVAANIQLIANKPTIVISGQTGETIQWVANYHLCVSI